MVLLNMEEESWRVSSTDEDDWWLVFLLLSLLLLRLRYAEGMAERV